MLRACSALAAFIVIPVLFSCNSAPERNDKETDWYTAIKERIMSDTEKEADSLTPANSEGSRVTESFYSKGTLLIDKHYWRANKALVETRYSPDKKFELRREIIYPSRKVFFEGIFYDGRPYGLSTWWFENGQIQRQGIRYSGREISIWKSWDESGNLTSEKNFGNEHLIDSLYAIKYD